MTTIKTRFSLLFCLFPLALAGCSSSNSSSLNMGLAGGEGSSGSGFGLALADTHEYKPVRRAPKSRALRSSGRVAAHKAVKSRKSQKLASLKRAPAVKKSLRSVLRKAPVIKVVPVRRLQAKTLKQPALPKLSAISPKNDLKLDLKAVGVKAPVKTAHIEIKPRRKAAAAKKSVSFTALPIEHKFVQSQPTFSQH